MVPVAWVTLCGRRYGLNVACGMYGIYEACGMYGIYVTCGLWYVCGMWYVSYAKYCGLSYLWE